MVAMKEVLPKTGPFFVSSFRLIPAGVLLVGFAAARGRPLPSGVMAWLSISLFALVDATCFQVRFLLFSFGVYISLEVSNGRVGTGTVLDGPGMARHCTFLDGHGHGAQHDKY